MTSLHVSKNRESIVSGNLRGVLKLFEFPCSSQTTNFFEAKVSKTPISQVRFLLDDSFLIVVGAESGAILRFKIVS